MPRQNPALTIFFASLLLMTVPLPARSAPRKNAWDYSMTKIGSLRKTPGLRIDEKYRYLPPLTALPLIPAATTFSNVYDGGGQTAPNSIQPTLDGGYIVAGYAKAGHVKHTPWVLKLNGNGTVEWQKTYGSDGSAMSIQPTTDGFIAAMYFEARYIGSEFYEGGFVVLKLDERGNIDWQKTYGSRTSHMPHSIQSIPQGGFIVLGGTLPFSPGVDDPNNLWVLKLDENGTVDWQKNYEAMSTDSAKSIQPTSDGGFIMAGGSSEPFSDFWVRKLDGSGNITWHKTYGGENWDSAASIQPTIDGGFIVAGSTGSFGNGMRDFWVLRLDGSGNVEWQKTYGGRGEDFASSIRPTRDGGLIVAGGTGSFGSTWGWKIWILKLDESGNVLWQKAYGKISDPQDVSDIQLTTDGGFIVGGGTRSYGDIQNVRAWILKLDKNGNVVACPSLPMATSWGSTETSVVPQDASTVATPNIVIGTISNESVMDATTTTSSTCPIRLNSDFPAPFP